MPRVLIAGIGNIFLGDDGFGVEVAGRLRGHPMGDDVDVADFGIRGVHLAFELAGGRYDTAILVDAVARGGPAGTLYVIEPDLGASAGSGVVADAHTLTPDAVIAWLHHVGGERPRIVIVGCEPESVEESMGLSPAVAASIDGAIETIRNLVGQISCA
jgi:hydrogenase maturation protease